MNQKQNIINQHQKGTPEDFQLPPTQSDNTSDAIKCALTRAKAITSLLTVAYTDNKNHALQPDDSTLLSAVWCLDGYLEQLEILTEKRENYEIVWGEK